MNLNDLYEMKDPRDAYERDVANSTSGFGKNSQAYRADGGANDERHDLDRQPTWYIRLNGKLIRDKAGNPYSFQSKAAANKAALTMQAKLFNKDKEFMLTTNPNDKSQGVAEGWVKGEYGRVLDALQLYYPRLGMTELNVPGYHKVIADKANVPVEYAAQVINDFARDDDPDEDEFSDFNDDEQGVAEDKQNSIAINGNEVDYSSLEVDGVDPSDYPDFSDAYFSSGYFTDGTPMSDEDLDQLTNTYGEMLYDKAYDSLHEASQAVDERTMGQPRVPAAKPEILSAVDDNKTITIRVRAPDGTTKSFSNSNPLIMQRWLNKYGLTLPHQISSKFVYEQGALDEEVRFPYPIRSEKLGRANMELLIKAYVEPTSARTTLSFGNRILELDRQDIEAVAHYYDNLLKDDTARWNFISGVMSDPDSLSDVLVKLGRRKSQTARQPGLFQEADKKKEDDVKDVALQRAISNARASFPTAGSGFEALSKQFMQSQDDDQRSIGNIKKANRRQDQLLSQINQIDQNQTQEIDSLEKDNDSLEQRLQQLQSVNARLEKTLSTMTGRNSSSQKAKTAEPSGSRSQKSIDIIPAKSTTPDAPAPRETPAPAKPAKPAKPDVKPAPLALPEPEAPSSMSSMTKQLTTQNPDVLEPATDFAKSSAPRFDTTGAQDVVARDVANKVRQNISKMGDAMVGNKLQQVANDELGKQQDWTQQSANDKLPRFGIRQAAENKESNPEAPEADYDDPKWDAMVKRVGQKAKEGPRKTVWDPVKRVYKTVPVNPVKEQEPGNRAGYNAIKSVSDWAEKMRTMRELQKDVSLMTDPSAKAAVQQRISELLKFGIQQGYVK